MPREVSRRFGASFGGRAPGTIEGGPASSSSAPCFELGGGQVKDSGGGASELDALASTSCIPRTVILRFLTDIDPIFAERGRS